MRTTATTMQLKQQQLLLKPIGITSSTPYSSKVNIRHRNQKVCSGGTRETDEKDNIDSGIAAKSWNRPRFNGKFQLSSIEESSPRSSKNYSGTGCQSNNASTIITPEKSPTLSADFEAVVAQAQSNPDDNNDNNNNYKSTESSTTTTTPMTAALTISTSKQNMRRSVNFSDSPSYPNSNSSSPTKCQPFNYLTSQERVPLKPALSSHLITSSGEIQHGKSKRTKDEENFDTNPQKFINLYRKQPSENAKKQPLESEDEVEDEVDNDKFHRSKGICSIMEFDEISKKTENVLQQRKSICIENVVSQREFGSTQTLKNLLDCFSGGNAFSTATVTTSITDPNKFAALTASLCAIQGFPSNKELFSMIQMESPKLSKQSSAIPPQLLQQQQQVQPALEFQPFQSDQQKHEPTTHVPKLYQPLAKDPTRKLSQRINTEQSHNRTKHQMSKSNERMSLKEQLMKKNSFKIIPDPSLHIPQKNNNNSSTRVASISTPKNNKSGIPAQNFKSNNNSATLKPEIPQISLAGIATPSSKRIEQISSIVIEPCSTDRNRTSLLRKSLTSRESPSSQSASQAIKKKPNLFQSPRQSTQILLQTKLSNSNTAHLSNKSNPFQIEDQKTIKEPQIIGGQRAGIVSATPSSPHASNQKNSIPSPSSANTAANKQKASLNHINLSAIKVALLPNGSYLKTSLQQNNSLSAQKLTSNMMLFHSNSIEEATQLQQEPSKLTELPIHNASVQQKQPRNRVSTQISSPVQENLYAQRKKPHSIHNDLPSNYQTLERSSTQEKANNDSSVVQNNSNNNNNNNNNSQFDLTSTKMKTSGSEIEVDAKSSKSPNNYYPQTNDQQIHHNENSSAQKWFSSVGKLKQAASENVNSVETTNLINGNILHQRSDLSYSSLKLLRDQYYSNIAAKNENKQLSNEIPSKLLAASAKAIHHPLNYMKQKPETLLINRSKQQANEITPSSKQYVHYKMSQNHCDAPNIDQQQASFFAS